MARKVLNRKELREESDAAERQQASTEEGAPAKKAAKPAKKKAAPKKPRAKKVAAEVRLKAFWGVFNQSMRRIAVFEYSQRQQAQDKAAALSESQKTPHFVQLVKEVIEQ